MKAGDYVEHIDGCEYRVVGKVPIIPSVLLELYNPRLGIVEYGRPQYLTLIQSWIPVVGDRVSYPSWFMGVRKDIEGEVVRINVLSVEVETQRSIGIASTSSLTWLPPLRAQVASTWFTTSTEAFNQLYANELGCSHEYKLYQGLMDSYEYCVKCDEKKEGNL